MGNTVFTGITRNRKYLYQIIISGIPSLLVLLFGAGISDSW
jgi:hypothetical protein